MVKKFVWKVQNIPAGINDERLLALFRSPERLRVRSICPDFDRAKCSIATVEYDPPPDDSLAAPVPLGDDDDDDKRPYVDREFWGFTPLYHPKSGNYDSEYARHLSRAGARAMY
jgi:hypothetical protein